MTAETPGFDTPAWRELRDAKLHEWVGDPDAVEALLTLFDAAELWDDLVDGDRPVDHAEQRDRVFWALLTELPLNPFFERFKHSLTPLIVVGISAWQDANELERGSRTEKAVAYVLRDWYMELVAFVIFLTRGRERLREISLEVRRFFLPHDDLDAYLEEHA